MDSAITQSDSAPITETEKIGRLTLLTALNRLGMSLRQVVLLLFVLELAFDEAFYGMVVATAGYVQSIVLFPAGTLSDRKGRGYSILIGGLVSGVALLMIPFLTNGISLLVLYGLTGVGGGFTMTSIDSLVADNTKRGNERTKSFGIILAVATLAATAGPFLGGYILDPIALPGLNPTMVRYAILFFFWGGLRIATGFMGLYTDLWLRRNNSHETQVIVEEEKADEKTIKSDMETALLFGFGQLIMGFSSGMVIPYMLAWVNAAYTPDPLVLGTIPAISNLTLASGTLFVGMSSERVGKLRMIGILYFLAPVLTFGIVYVPIFLVMLVFYVSRQAVANMARPAMTSLLTGEISRERRARSISITRIMWQLPRQTGTLFTSFLLTLGLFGGIVPFGVIVFPIAMCFYPISVIPLYIAVRRNRSRRKAE
jgi:MFS family permease